MNPLARLPVFFSPKMVADSGSYSPSAAKPKLVVEHWASAEPRVPIEILTPEPVEPLDFARVHDAGYVLGVLDRKLDNGFGNRRKDVAATLPWTTGAMLSAARHALAFPDAPATCAPVSGFHHASWGQGGGFCTFNGLCVTAAVLLHEELAEHVGILDADMHWGNGTVDILNRVKHLRERVVHITFGREYTQPTQADAFLARLPEIVRRLAGCCDVVLYQAGADPHLDDPQGGWLTTEQLAERDRIVFEGLRAARCPCVWNLAGGYQMERDGSIPKVLAIHTNTARAALRAAGVAA